MRCPRLFLPRPPSPPVCTASRKGTCALLAHPRPRPRRPQARRSIIQHRGRTRRRVALESACPRPCAGPWTSRDCATRGRGVTRRHGDSDNGPRLLFKGALMSPPLLSLSASLPVSVPPAALSLCDRIVPLRLLPVPPAARARRRLLLLVFRPPPARPPAHPPPAARQSTILPVRAGVHTAHARQAFSRRFLTRISYAY